jgi:hypothetical protein
MFAHNGPNLINIGDGNYIKASEAYILSSFCFKVIRCGDANRCSLLLQLLHSGPSASVCTNVSVVKISQVRCVDALFTSLFLIPLLLLNDRAPSASGMQKAQFCMTVRYHA